MSGEPGHPPGEALHWCPAPRPRREEIRGSHVVLRPLQASDAEDLYRVSHPPAGDAGIWTYLFDGPYESAETLRRQLEHNQALDDPLFFTLVRLPEQRPEGIASYLRIAPDQGVIEIGHIWFGTPLQRTTAATEAIYLLLRHAFDGLGYRRVEWKCNSLNQPSRRAAERFGFQFEGVFRQHMVVKDRNRDTAWYAMTDGDWPARRAAFEAWLAAENFDARGRQLRSLSALSSSSRPRPSGGLP